MQAIYFAFYNWLHFPLFQPDTYFCCFFGLPYFQQLIQLQLIDSIYQLFYIFNLIYYNYSAYTTIINTCSIDPSITGLEYSLNTIQKIMDFLYVVAIIFNLLMELTMKFIIICFYICIEAKIKQEYGYLTKNHNIVKIIFLQFKIEKYVICFYIFLIDILFDLSIFSQLYIFSVNYIITMLPQHLSRIVQTIIALPLLILTATYWIDNRIGQNILNLCAGSLYLIGMDHIIIAYRWYNGKQSFEYELTVVVGVLFVLGKLFEKFHPSERQIKFNQICEWNIILVLLLNIIFLVFLFIVIILYCFRQIYRLMTQSLLSTAQNLQPSQLIQISDMKRPFDLIIKEFPQVSPTCSICLMEFQLDNNAILLPGCQHCFHQQCIDGWLQNHSTCPYCRNNIRLSLL